ncbi:Zinc finger, PMZ-type [Sesbania bispinosa]|nr:Zinc finger, PMZ-type [Sesbania bispinosa]
MVAEFKRCMLGDYELHQFHRKWEKMVIEFGLDDNAWVKDTFEKRRMWATAYIRDFLENFRRCLDSFRYRELEADFASVHGEPIMQTNIKSLEKSACRNFTREVFTLFLPGLVRGSTVRVKSTTQLMSQTIFTVSKYGRPGKEWHVSGMPHPFQIKCSCRRMESFGLPCEHIVGVLVHLNTEEMPKSLVLDRWTMAIKEKIHGHNEWLRETDEGNGEDNENKEEGGTIKDPVRVGSKGCAATSSSQPSRSRKRQRCRICGEVGHNRATCSRVRRFCESVPSQEVNGDADESCMNPVGGTQVDSNDYIDNATWMNDLGEKFVRCHNVPD